MDKLLQRIVMAYRPLYLHGLLLDGQYRLPKAEAPHGQASAATTTASSPFPRPAAAGPEGLRPQADPMPRPTMMPFHHPRSSP